MLTDRTWTYHEKKPQFLKVLWNTVVILDILKVSQQRPLLHKE